MAKKQRCANCKNFKDFYYKDGKPAFLGKCSLPGTKSRLATTGMYQNNICSKYEEREEEILINENISSM